MNVLRAKKVFSKNWDNSVGYIYVNGCSHTVGTTLSLPNKYDSYAFVLGELLGLNAVSSASSASSNQRIYRSTIDFFSDAEKMPEIAIIQWSGVDRFETPDNLKKMKDLVHVSQQVGTPTGIDENHEGWYQHLPATVFDKTRSTLNIPFRKFYREAIYPDGKSNSTRSKMEAANAAQILGLDAYLKSLGVRVVHLIWEGFTKNNINPPLQVMLDTVEIPMDDPYEALCDVIHSRGYKLYHDVFPEDEVVDWHYMADAHYQIATWLYAYIQYGTKIQISDGKIDNRNLDIIHHYNLGR